MSKLHNKIEALAREPVATEWLIAMCHEVPTEGRHTRNGNIVATMLAYGERGLLAFKTADFRQYDDRIELVDSLQDSDFEGAHDDKLLLI